LTDVLMVKDAKAELGIKSDSLWSRIRQHPKFPRPFRYWPGGRPHWLRRQLDEFKALLSQEDMR
jgi:hypothetical protein